MKLTEVRLKTGWNAAHILNGEEGIALVSQGKDIPPAPEEFGDDTFGQAVALYQKLGQEVIAALRREDVQVVIEDDKAMVRQQEKLLVDSNGRFIFENFAITEFVNADWSYGFDQSIQPSYEEILERAKHVFQVNDIGLTAAQFQERAEAKKAETLAGPWANLFRGKYARPLAVPIPSVKIAKGGLGKVLAEIFVPAVERGYKFQFPKRAFNNHRKGTLEGQVKTFPGSRQERLIAAMAEGPVVLWVSLNCLQGGSFNADREMTSKLPEEFMLGGTIANGTAVALYPEIAAASSKNPLYYNAADFWGSSGSLCLYPRGSDLGFDGWYGLAHRDGGCSGSVALLA